MMRMKSKKNLGEIEEQCYTIREDKKKNLSESVNVNLWNISRMIMHDYLHLSLKRMYLACINVLKTAPIYLFIYFLLIHA